MSMLFKRIKDWATSITTFRTGDVIPVDGPSGTAKMSKDDLLKKTAENAVDSGVAAGVDDVFGKTLFKSTYTAHKYDASNTATADYLNSHVFSLHLVNTVGYAGCSLMIAGPDDYSVVATKKIKVVVKNKKNTPVSGLYLSICKNASWQYVLFSKTATFSDYFEYDVDLSSVGITGTTNLSVYLQDTHGVQDVELEVYCIEQESNVNSLGAITSENSKYLGGISAGAYMTKDDAGRVDLFGANTELGFITNDAVANPVSGSVVGNILTVDLNKTATTGYTGVTALIASDASKIASDTLSIKFKNKEASSCTFDIGLIKNRLNWSPVYGWKEVSIPALSDVIINVNIADYAASLGSSAVYLMVRNQPSGVQHVELDVFGYRYISSEFPNVDTSRDAKKLGGRNAAEYITDHDLSEQVFKGSFTGIVNGGTNAVSAVYDAGMYTINFTRDSSGYAGIIINLENDASKVTNRTPVLIVKNTSNTDISSLQLALSKYQNNWSTVKWLHGESLAAGETKKIRYDFSQYAAYFSTGYIGFLFRLNDTSKSVSLKACLVYEKDFSNAVNISMDTFGLEGKTLEQVSYGKYITCWGDSLTAIGGWTAKLKELSGIDVFNCGVGGENSKTISSRQGADAIVVDGVTVPATVTAVNIGNSSLETFSGDSVTPLLQSSPSFNPCKLGDIEGTLSYSSGVYSFTRSVAGDAVVIARPTVLRTKSDYMYNSPYLMIIFMGQNGGWDNDVDKLIKQHRRMIEHAHARNVIVLGLSSGTASERSSYETAMQDEFGRYFISLRQYLAHPIYSGDTIVNCYGLADAGLTPTSADLDDIAVGKVPPQCLADGVHYTDATKIVIGNMLFKKCQELNIF